MASYIQLDLGTLALFKEHVTSRLRKKFTNLTFGAYAMVQECLDCQTVRGKEKNMV